MAPIVKSDLSLGTCVFDLAILDGPDVVMRKRNQRMGLVVVDVNMVCML